jgi:hypothetical protein
VLGVTYDQKFLLLFFLSVLLFLIYVCMTAWLEGARVSPTFLGLKCKEKLKICGGNLKDATGKICEFEIIKLRITLQSVLHQDIYNNTNLEYRVL